MGLLRPQPHLFGFRPKTRWSPARASHVPAPPNKVLQRTGTPRGPRGLVAWAKLFGAVAGRSRGRPLNGMSVRRRMRTVNLPVLTVDEYRSLVQVLPVPTTSQRDAFAAFVSQAHSWYKHIPPAPPCCPFYFFLDPSAGMQREVTSGGSVRSIVREERGFHYSWIPTKEYRARFGHLAV